MAEQPSKMKWKEYSKELQKLQAELCHLQEWVLNALLGFVQESRAEQSVRVEA